MRIESIDWNLTGGSSYKAGEVVQFHCHRGFMVEGQPIAVCQDNGKWSGNFPKCNFNLIIIEITDCKINLNLI